MNIKRDVAGLIGGGLLIFSLFMPWISAGGLSQNAIDIKYGYALLLLGATACAIAVFNITIKKASRLHAAYPILGLLSLVLLYMNYGDLARRAERTAYNFPFMSDFIHGFIGVGIYVGLIGCALMIGSAYLKSE